LLANIALSVLDDYFVQAWQQTMSDHNAVPASTQGTGELAAHSIRR
jgi:hypothetical protein